MVSRNFSGSLIGLFLFLPVSIFTIIFERNQQNDQSDLYNLDWRYHWIIVIRFTIFYDLSNHLNIAFLDKTINSSSLLLFLTSKARKLYGLNRDSRGKIDKNLKPDVCDLEGGESRISIQSQSNEIEQKDYSIPLLIVANKIDKLNLSEKIALQTACSQQVFVVSTTLGHVWKT